MLGPSRRLAPPLRPPRSPGSTFSGWPWITLALSAAAAGAGGLFGLLSANARDDALGGENHLAATDAFQRSEDLAVGAHVSFAVAGGFALTSLIWFLVELLAGSPDADADADADTDADTDADADGEAAPRLTGTLGVTWL